MSRAKGKASKKKAAAAAPFKVGQRVKVLGGDYGNARGTVQGCSGEGVAVLVAPSLMSMACGKCGLQPWGRPGHCPAADCPLRPSSEKNKQKQLVTTRKRKPARGSRYDRKIG